MGQLRDERRVDAARVSDDCRLERSDRGQQALGFLVKCRVAHDLEVTEVMQKGDSWLTNPPLSFHLYEQVLPGGQRHGFVVDLCGQRGLFEDFAMLFVGRDHDRSVGRFIGFGRVDQYDVAFQNRFG